MWVITSPRKQILLGPWLGVHMGDAWAMANLSAASKKAALAEARARVADKAKSWMAANIGEGFELQPKSRSRGKGHVGGHIASEAVIAGALTGGVGGRLGDGEPAECSQSGRARGWIEAGLHGIVHCDGSEPGPDTTICGTAPCRLPEWSLSG